MSIQPHETMRRVQRCYNGFGALRRHYGNWPRIAAAGALHRETVVACLRGGETVALRLWNLDSFTWILDHGWTVLRANGGRALVEKESVKLWLRLDRSHDPLGVKEIFERACYGRDFAGKTVIDAGVNGGDSAICFAARGASLVVGLEPDPESFGLAQENVRLNGLDGKVRLLNAALADRDGEAELLTDPTDSSSDHLDLPETRPLYRGLTRFSVATKVCTFSLETLMRRFGIGKVDLLKMDCEGAEHEVIRSLGSEMALRIGGVVLEAHNGPQQIPQRLGAFGFQVSQYEIDGERYIKATRP